MRELLVIGRRHGKTERLIREAYQQGRAEAIDEYTEWLRKRHANFDEEYAEDVESEYLEWLKEQKNG